MERILFPSPHHICLVCFFFLSLRLEIYNTLLINSANSWYKKHFRLVGLHISRWSIGTPQIVPIPGSADSNGTIFKYTIDIKVNEVSIKLKISGLKCLLSHSSKNFRWSSTKRGESIKKNIECPLKFTIVVQSLLNVVIL